MIDDDNLVKRNVYFYVSNDAIVKEKIIKKHYDDLLSRHFETQKTLNLIQNKYY